MHWRIATLSRFFKSPCGSIENGTALPSVRGSAKPRPNSITSAPRSAGRSRSETTCVPGSLLAGALARLWYSLSPVEGRRWVRLAIDSITEEHSGRRTCSALYCRCGALLARSANRRSSLASAEQALAVRSMLDDLQVARAQHAAGSALAATGKASKGEDTSAESAGCCRTPRESPSAGVSLERSRNRSLSPRRRRRCAPILRRSARTLRFAWPRETGRIDRGAPCGSRIRGGRCGRCVASSRGGSRRPRRDPQSPFGSGRFEQYGGISRSTRLF